MKMVIQKIQKSKLFTFLVFVTFFVSLVESVPISCPYTSAANNGAEPLKSYIVLLDATSPITVKEHFDMLKRCLQKTVLKSRDLGYIPDTDNVILDFSIDGGFAGYEGKFTQSFVVNQLSTSAEVLAWAENVMIAINDDMVIANKTESLTDSLNALNTEKTNLKNLDRIDQKNFPLDGKYTFPASAGEGVNVYVIDTGININHIDFQGRARFAASFCNGCPLQDDNGHGSMVAGIIGGNFFGVAKKTNLIAVKVLDSFGQGTLLSVIDGMAYVFEQHTAATNKKTVVNMSLIVTTKSQILNTVLAKLVQAGIVVSVAAGNDATDACNESPSSAPEALTVGATQLDNDTIASFSNWGPCIDIFAPGVNIESSGGFTPDHVVVGSGTSFSSPHVAGTAALILGDNQNVLSPAQVAEEIIKISTKNAVKGLNSLPKKTPNRFLRVPQKW